MKKLLTGLSLFALIFAANLGAQTYDRNEVVKTMRQNLTLLNEVKAALGASKYGDAADKFYQFAKGYNSLLAFTPPKGTKADWDRINGASVTAALKGVTASFASDKVKAQAALDELLALSAEGHKAFR